MVTRPSTAEPTWRAISGCVSSVAYSRSRSPPELTSVSRCGFPVFIWGRPRESTIARMLDHERRERRADLIAPFRLEPGSKVVLHKDFDIRTGLEQQGGR